MSRHRSFKNRAYSYDDDYGDEDYYDEEEDIRLEEEQRKLREARRQSEVAQFLTPSHTPMQSRNPSCNDLSDLQQSGLAGQLAARDASLGSSSSSSGAPAVSFSEAISTLSAMGFHEEQCRKALGMCMTQSAIHQNLYNVEKAMNLLLSSTSTESNSNSYFNSNSATSTPVRDNRSITFNDVRVDTDVNSSSGSSFFSASPPKAVYHQSNKNNNKSSSSSSSGSGSGSRSGGWGGAASSSSISSLPPTSIAPAPPSSAIKTPDSKKPPLAPTKSQSQTTPSTPSSHIKFEKSDKFDLPDDSLTSNKTRLTMAVFGHVDAGKSTLMGQLLLQLKYVDARQIEKYRKQASEIGKAR